MRSEGAKEHALHFAFLGLLRSDDPAANLLGHQGVVVGQLLQVAGAQQVSAAVAHVSETKLAAVNPPGRECGAHAALLRVFLRGLVDTRIRLQNGVLQKARLLSPVFAGRSSERDLRVYFRRGTYSF